jgi:E3 ubiquitin-protein ligase RNF115/126
LIAPSTPGICLLGHTARLAFRALRQTGLALSLGLTALAAYQGIREAMADPPSGRTGSSSHLDASGPREVVYCHGCENEWYKEQFGLKCPRCEGEATEIVSSSTQWQRGERQLEMASDIRLQVTDDNDPRERASSPEPEEDLHPLHDHIHDNNLWLDDDDVPDPDEDDVEEYITHGLGGRTTFVSSTFTTRGRRGPPGNPRNRHPPIDPDDPANLIRDFHSMVSHLMGPNHRQGRAGRSGPETLFPRGEPEPFRRTQFGGRMAGVGLDGPHIVGHRITWTTGGRQPRGDPEAQDIAADDFATYASPASPASPVSPRSASGPSFLVISIRARPDQLASILGGLFNAMGPLGQTQHPDGEPNGQRGNMPLSLQGIFASLLNPANAVAGDAVYSQEALDRIISTLMEQHPQSNAPGPASQEAIASLPKKKLDEKMLGPELKAECSVCMDDVTVGVEVVVLPCTHWFHEACATAWLNEHNTCPICRTGIGGEQPSPPPQRARQNSPPPIIPIISEDIRSRRTSYRRHSANEARLNAIRDRGRLSPPAESSTRRLHMVGDPTRSRNRTPSPPLMPGGYGSHFRRRDSEISENQRESRRNTSGSDRSHRSSNSGNTGESGGSNGPMAWFRRFRRQE